MELRPNDAPVMEKGETRTFEVNVSGAAGTNNINGTPSATCDHLTIGTATASGLVITFDVTASRTGTHRILVSADLDSGETVKGFIRTKVVDSTCDSDGSDYGGW